MKALAAAIVHPSPRQRALTALLVGLLAAAYMLFTAWQQDRELIPKFHDEFMHLLQMRMMASGRLWLPALPPEIAPSLDTFHVLVTPVYASIYFPGTALLYLPTIWLGLPHWVMPWLAGAASVALFYAIVSEMIDNVSGLLGALLLLSLSFFRFIAMVTMSHGAIVFLGLLLIFCFLRWRTRHDLRWAAALGAVAGWAAITRPVDSIAYAAPAFLGVLLAMRPMPWRRRWQTVAIIAAAAAPFIGLQVALNIGVTGNPLKTPYQLYAEQDSPNLAYGFGHGQAEILRSRVPQKVDFYREFLLPEIERHRPANALPILLKERIWRIANVATPTPWLLILYPLSLLGLRHNARWIFWSMLPLYLALYAMFPFLLPHYAIVPAPAVLLGVLIGKRVLEDLLPQRRRPMCNLILSLAIAVVAVATLPEFDRERLDDGYPRPTMWYAARVMPDQVRPPAIVLFRYRGGVDSPHEEPVYNVDVTDPRDAPILRAHDLGPEQNRALIEYFARRQPPRNVYLFDRAARTLVPLGDAAELSRRMSQP